MRSDGQWVPDMSDDTNDLLSELNDDQRQAVEHEGSPLLILAGPGTGKTRVTTSKLAYLIREKGLAPEEILALTFSEKAAAEMQERVEDLLPMSSRVQIYTFHSFCLEIVREYALELGVNARGEVFTGEFQEAFILEHLDEFGLEHFTVPPRPMELARTFQGAIARFKQENISIGHLEKYLKGDEAETGDGEGLGVRGGEGKEEGKGGGEGKGELKGGGGGEENEERAKLSDLAKVYRAYEDFKWSRGFIDFGDMQFLALKLLRNWPDATAKYRDQFKHIIVDEFQDTDFIQLQILLTLAPDGNITVVGDDDQAIYRFRGAYLTNIMEFIGWYERNGIQPTQILLGTNYRCSENIQTVAGNLISHNSDRGVKEIEAPKKSNEPVHITRFSNDREQARGIAREIRDLHDHQENGKEDDIEAAKSPWGQFAILVRRRIDSRMIIEELERSGIPYEVLGSRPFFSIPIIRVLVSYLRVLNDPISNGPALAHVMLRPCNGLLPEELPRISRYAKGNQLSLWEALGDLGDYDGDPTHLRNFRTRMDELFSIAGEKGLLSLVRHLILGKYFMGMALSRDDLEQVRLLNSFLEITTRFGRIYPDSSLGDFLIHLDALRDLGAEDGSQEPTGDRVHLMTVHGSKGREFPVVFVPNLGKNKFPSKFQRYKIDIPEVLLEGTSPRGTPQDIHEQEERRLLYVAITRAEDSCFLSSSERYGTNIRETPVSIFIEEILQKEGGWKKMETPDQDVSEEQADTPGETQFDAIYDRLITNIHRKEWQEAVTCIGTLASLENSTPGTLKIPGPDEIEAYLSTIKLSQREPIRKHLERITYSPTRLNKFETCPKQYWYSYVMGIPGEWKSFFALGSAVHEAIEIVTKKMMVGEVVSDEVALEILESLWDPMQYGSREMEREDRRSAEEMIRQFLRHQDMREGSIHGVEEWIGLDLDGRRLRGKVDRIDLLADGRLEVIDYKSSKSKTSRPKLKQDFQMALYWLGVEQAYNRKVSQVGHWYLRMDKEWMVEVTPEELKLVRQRAIEVIEGIESGVYPATPGIQTCQWCDFQMLCDERWE